jgi:hypothetical protein
MQYANAPSLCVSNSNTCILRARILHQQPRRIRHHSIEHSMQRLKSPIFMLPLESCFRCFHAMNCLRVENVHDAYANHNERLMYFSKGYSGILMF